MRKRRKRILSFCRTTFQGIAIASLGTLGLNYSASVFLFGIGALICAVAFLFMEMEG